MRQELDVKKFACCPEKWRIYFLPVDHQSKKVVAFCPYMGLFAYGETPQEAAVKWVLNAQDICQHTCFFVPLLKSHTKIWLGRSSQNIETFVIDGIENPRLTTQLSTEQCGTFKTIFCPSTNQTAYIPIDLKEDHLGDELASSSDSVTMGKGTFDAEVFEEKGDNQDTLDLTPYAMLDFTVLTSELITAKHRPVCDHSIGEDFVLRPYTMTPHLLP